MNCYMFEVRKSFFRNKKNVGITFSWNTGSIRTKLLIGKGIPFTHTITEDKISLYDRLGLLIVGLEFFVTSNLARSGRSDQSQTYL